MTQELVNAFKKVTGKENILFAIANAGFADVQLESLVCPEFQDQDIPDAVDFLQRSDFGSVLFAKASREQAAAGWAAVAAALRPHQREDGVYLDGAAWLVTARA